MSEIKYEVEPKSNLDCDEVDKIIKQSIEEAKKDNPDKKSELEEIEVKHSKRHKMRLSEGLPDIHLIIILLSQPMIQEIFRELVLPKLKEKFKNFSRKDDGL